MIVFAVLIMLGTAGLAHKDGARPAGPGRDAEPDDGRLHEESAPIAST